MTGRQENVKWVDGLRGIASLLVVITHLARGLDEDVFKSISEEGVSPRFLQYPIIRVFIQGRIGIIIFSLVTGYVCALKPIRQFRAGNQEAAFTGISKSAFRRIPRLVLPTTIVTVTIWFICQFGVFEVANHTEGWWLAYTAPDMSLWRDAFRELSLNIITTWAAGWNRFDVNQWTLLPLLKGAFLVYIMLVATACTRPRYRMMIEMALFVYFYIGNDPQFGLQFFFGVFLSELAQEPTHQAWLSARKWPGRVLAPFLIFIGFVLASYPEKNPEWTPWSQKMLELGLWIFPRDVEFPRYYSALGLEFIALGIHFSSGVKGVLSNKYLLWLGKNSFAVYLLHGTLLRSVLVWMLFGVRIPPDVQLEDESMVPGKLQACGALRFWFWVPIWFALLYTLANLWTKYVDPLCARITQRLENYVFDEPYKSLPSEKPILVTLPQ